MAKSKPSLPKGTRDFGTEQSAKRSYIIDIITKNFRKYGFQKIETPAMEQLSVLTGKYGDEGDQLIFKILNSGDYLKNSNPEDLGKGSQAMLEKISEKGLRYDLTVPFARFVVQNQNDITFPFKRFQIQPVWRADRPQKGRYREFYQCDADIIGTNSLWNEAELTLLIHDVFFDLGLSDFSLKINHRELLNALAASAGLTGKEIPFCVAIDKLDKVGKEQVSKELIELGATNESLNPIFDLFELSQSFDEKILTIEKVIGSNKGTSELITFYEYLKSAANRELKVDLDFSLARGLTYYTGMIFEVKSTKVQIGSITGGGRYDNLTGVFGLEGISGVGISFGLDRIYDVLEELELFPASLNQTSQVLITHFDEESFVHGLGLLKQLRQSGISAEIYPEVSKLKKQFNYANKKNIAYVITIGTDEITTAVYPLKNMADGSQTVYSTAEIINQLGDRL